MAKQLKQRYKIYAAETDMVRLYFSTVEAAQGWIDWVCKTKWWKDRCTVRHIKLKYPTYYMSGATKLSDENAEIEVYAYCLDVLTLCHEMAHLIYWIPGNNQEKDHNAKFAGIYIALVKRFIGKAASEELKTCFKEHGVKWEECK